MGCVTGVIEPGHLRGDPVFRVPYRESGRVGVGYFYLVPRVILTLGSPSGMNPVLPGDQNFKWPLKTSFIAVRNGYLSPLK